MKVLFIGGTGTISMAITRQLAEGGHDVYLLNRGSRTPELQKEDPEFDAWCDKVIEVMEKAKKEFA